jgi:hypothetical protein
LHTITHAPSSEFNEQQFGTDKSTLTALLDTSRLVGHFTSLAFANGVTGSPNLLAYNKALFEVYNRHLRGHSLLKQVPLTSIASMEKQQSAAKNSHCFESKTNLANIYAAKRTLLTVMTSTLQIMSFLQLARLPT